LELGHQTGRGSPLAIDVDGQRFDTYPQRGGVLPLIDGEGCSSGRADASFEVAVVRVTVIDAADADTRQVVTARQAGSEGE
jgi:hypothetical protein